MPRHLAPFAPGTDIAGLIVQHETASADLPAYQKYWVRYSACEHESEMSHQALVRRRQRGDTSGLCQRCAVRERRTRAGRPYQPGTEYSGLIVLEITHETRPLKGCRYQVRYLCCGRTHETTHNAIATRMSRGIELCLHCSSAQNGRTSQRARIKKALKCQAADAVDANGYLWPALTRHAPMGPRGLVWMGE